MKIRIKKKSLYLILESTSYLFRTKRISENIFISLIGTLILLSPFLLFIAKSKIIFSEDILKIIERLFDSKSPIPILYLYIIPGFFQITAGMYLFGTSKEFIYLSTTTPLGFKQFLLSRIFLLRISSIVLGIPSIISCILLKSYLIESITFTLYHIFVTSTLFTLFSFSSSAPINTTETSILNFDSHGLTQIFLGSIIMFFGYLIFYTICVLFGRTIAIVVLLFLSFSSLLTNSIWLKKFEYIFNIKKYEFWRRFINDRGN